MSADEGPLSRWSRRKAESRDDAKPVRTRGSAAPAPPEEPSATGAAPAVVEPGGTEPDSAAPPPDLPDIESLNADSDFTVFMREGVPSELRKLALRKLWRSDPIFANVDGLMEYGEDFAEPSDLIAQAKRAYDAAREQLGEKDGESDDVEETEIEPDEPSDGETDTDEEKSEERPVVAEDETDPTQGTG